VKKKPRRMFRRPAPVGVGIFRVPSEHEGRIALARCGRYPQTPNHTVMMTCFHCGCDVFTQPEVIDAMRGTAPVQVFVCNVCMDDPANAGEFGRHFLDPKE
jgi:hypothetical protein